MILSNRPAGHQEVMSPTKKQPKPFNKSNNVNCPHSVPDSVAFNKSEPLSLAEEGEREQRTDEQEAAQPGDDVELA
jgi:hypothetical protein